MSVPVGHPFSLSMSILLADVPLLERPFIARRLGFEFVESWWPWNDEVATAGEIDDLARSLEAGGAQLILLNVCEGDARHGGRGLAGVVGADAAFWNNWYSVLHVAARAGTQHLNVLVGDRAIHHRAAGSQSRARGDDATVLSRLTERLAVLADQAYDVGAGVVVEQLNRLDHPNYLLTDPADAVAVTRGARALSKHGNIGLLADLYHVAKSGTDPVAFAAEHADLVRHVQIADNPGRGRPGSGTIAIRETLDALFRGGYAGMIGLEYNPSADEREILDRPDELWRTVCAPIPQGDFST
ncbi:MAG: hyi [Subtercola sp.]|nr:hyi [Subtercola sp.]